MTVTGGGAAQWAKPAKLKAIVGASAFSSAKDELREP